MKVRLIIEAPGSEGRAALLLTPQEYALLQRVADIFNAKNPGHAAPYIRMELANKGLQTGEEPA